MTQKFKFGDLVRLKTNGGTGIVARVGSQSNIWVIFDGYTIAEIYKAEELELIPSPDTVRLDWLAENDCALTKNLCDEDGDIHPTPNAVIQKQEDHFEVLAATSNDIREAIDVAMAHIESKR